MFKKIILTLVLVLTSLNLTAKSFSERRAERNQADFAIMVNKKLDQIEKRYKNELAALSTNIASTSAAINAHANADYWIFPLTRYRSAIANYDRILNRFKTGAILGEWHVLHSNPQLQQTLRRIELVQANLYKIDCYIRQDANFMQENKNQKFLLIALAVITIPALIIGGLVIGALGLKLILIPVTVSLFAFPIGVLSLGAAATSIGLGVTGAIYIDNEVKNLDDLINQTA